MSDQECESPRSPAHPGDPAGGGEGPSEYRSGHFGHSSIETTRKYLHKNEEIEREAIESMSSHLSMESLLNTPQLNGAKKRGKFAGVLLPDFSDKGKANGR